MNRILEWAAGESGISEDKLMATLDNWEDIRTTNDWRNHVPDEIASHWHSLPVSAKLIAFGFASRLSDIESWSEE